MMKENALLKLAFPVLFIIIGTWLGGWFFSATNEIKNLTDQPLNDVFNSLNALFAGLAFGGVIITVYLQIEELRDTRIELTKTSEANQKMADDSRERSVLELYQLYSSQHFQEIKTNAMKVLTGCVKNKDYCDYVISRFFVTEQLMLNQQIFEALQEHFECDNFEQFIKNEREARFQLDELINFFSILTGRVESFNIIKTCDFFYAWWRPLFWMIATLQEKRYQENPSISEYSLEPLLMRCVSRLDTIYGFEPFTTQKKTWLYIIEHPKIKDFGISPEFNHFIE